MEIAGEYVFHGLREEVWDLVRDPDVLSTALPGAQKLEKVSDQEYVGDMNIRVGPVSGLFSGRLLVSNEVPPESYTMTVNGKGGPGFVKGTGDVQLVDQGDGTTLMKYEGDMQIGGTLASVGQRMLDTVSRSLIRQGLETLDKALQERVAARSEGREAEVEAPTETEFAAAVAKDMAGEALSSRWLWIAVVVVIAIVTVAVILTIGGGG